MGDRESIITEKGVSNLLSDCTPFSLSFTGYAPENERFTQLFGMAFSS